MAIRLLWQAPRLNLILDWLCSFQAVPAFEMGIRFRSMELYIHLNLLAHQRLGRLALLVTLRRRSLRIVFEPR